MDGVLRSIFGRGPAEKRGVTVVPDFRSVVRATASGVTVTEESALRLAAVYACVRVLAETVATLPLFVYERLPGGGRRRAPDHPLYDLLHSNPNPEMTRVDFMETVMGHVALWGNSVSQIEWLRSGRPAALWPVQPNRVVVKRDRAGRIVYEVDSKATLQTGEVVHARGLSGNGLVGYSPIRLMRESIGLGLAAQEYGAAFFSNDATPSGILMHPGELGKEGTDNILESWDAQHRGAGNSHRIQVLEEGMKYEAIGIPPEDAQFIETRKFQRTEIASIFRVPPHLIMDLERSTNNNIEHQSIEFTVHTIRPWVVRWEQAMMRALLTPAERKRFFIEFQLDGLLRGDMRSRYEAYSVAINVGFMSRNEVRALENLNPFDGGDEFLVPLNMGTQDGEANPQPRAMRAEARGRRSVDQRRRLGDQHRALYTETLGRILRREANDVGAAARRLLDRRGRAEFEQWLTEFYREHQGYVIDQMLPVAEAYGGGIARAAAEELDEPEPDADVLRRWIAAYVRGFAARLSARQMDRVLELLAAEDPLPALEEEFTAWRETRPEQVARTEIVRLGGAAAVMVFGYYGVTHLRWVTAGAETCPYCRALDGTVVGIRDAFLSAGDAFQPEGADSPLTVSRNVGHPPAHSGCDCSVAAA